MGGVMNKELKDKIYITWKDFKKGAKKSTLFEDVNNKIIKDLENECGCKDCNDMF